MTWQVAAFGVLGLALVGGFAWYERTRPDARVVALVGTLAAFAALGRIAFAAVPNVKPTTDIVLLAGFALGGAPGFAVGAIAGLTSNFFFGQGPWTPWQMAAWGATGVLGAILARATRGRIGRWPLAIVCGAAGFAFTAVQDAGDWVLYTDHSAAQLGAYVGQGLGFDAVHAVGCVVFALAFGPALIRSVARFARRIEVTWIPPAAAPVAVVAVCAAAVAAGASQPPPARAATAGRSQVSYLEHAQNPDGGLGSAPGERSDPLFSGWAALGLESAGVDVATLRRGPGRPTLLDDVATTASTGDVGALERTILVAVGAGADPARLGGHDLVTALRRRVSRDGAIQGEVNLTAFGLLALRAAGASSSLQARSAGWLEGAAGAGGGYGLVPGGEADADDTGAVLEALGGAPGARAARARRRAVAWLRGHQDRDGGFATEGTTGSNAQSTAWAVQGLIAARVDPDTLRQAGDTPTGYLRSLVRSDGSVAYARGQAQTPVWVTGEALMALAGRALPIAAPVTTTSTTTPAPPAHARRQVSLAVTRMATRVCALPSLIVARARFGQ